jgi:hypothetical protein
MVRAKFNRRNALRPRPGRPLWSKPAPQRRLPPSSAVINAVLEHADLRDDMGGGRVLLRISPDLLSDRDFGAELGAEASQLGDVAILWDEVEDQIVRVLDGRNAAYKPQLATSNAKAPPADEPRFALTPEAETYLAGQKGKAKRG